MATEERLNAGIQELAGAISVKVSTGALIRRMERLRDFDHDDEDVELTRRLDAEGKTWGWSSDNKIVIVNPDECEHNPKMLYSWMANDGVLVVCCRACKQVLRGGVENGIS